MPAETSIRRCRALLVLAVSCLAGEAALGQVLARVSVSSSGAQGNDDSLSPSISSDGRFVAFSSAANNLVPGDTDSFSDVFIHDRQTGETQLVSLADEGLADCTEPSLSADARFVAFTEAYWVLVSDPWDMDPVWRFRASILLRDLQAGQTTRLTPASGTCRQPRLSADGRYVAYASCSYADWAPWGPGDLIDATVAVLDRQTGQTTGVPGLHTWWSLPSPDISADGRFVASWSADDVAELGDTNALSDAFVHDFQTGQTTLVSVSSTGTQGDGDSWYSTLSDDGRLVLFRSVAGNLSPGDSAAVGEEFIHDRQTGQTTRLHEAYSDGQAADGSRVVNFGAGGRYVAFGSQGSELVPGDTNGQSDVFVHDLATGQTTRVSVRANGAQANGGSSSSAMSADGRFVAFESSATNLVAGDTNGVSDIFVAQATNWPAFLRYAGTAGYETDGVEPDSGPAATTFTFQALYTDPAGAAPRVARCDIYQGLCGNWYHYANMALAQLSGDVTTGALFAGARRLPGGYQYRYQFVFKTGTGAQLEWPAGYPLDGPSVSGPPRLCWAGGTGYESDGVAPDAGAPGSKFLFRVLYADTAGEVPSLAELQVRREGKIRYKRAMKLDDAAPDYQGGAPYRFLLPIAEAGTYEYRFRFRNSAKAAVGAPAAWQPGPEVTAGGAPGAAVALTSLAALPTPAGAELRFVLSSPAEVTATVLNVSGRPVRTIVADRPLSAGLQSLAWDRRADTGLAVPSGLYVIRLTARTAQGAQSSAVATVRLR